MNKELLPLGTVVKLKGAKKNLFVVGYGVEGSDGSFYDYVGFPYPEGFINKETNLLFNNEDISKVLYVGYKDKYFTLVEKQVINFLEEKRNQ